MKPIEEMIDSVVKCLKCGAAGIGTCDCWEECSCGWYADKEKPCGNPNTSRCSTKVKYGKYNRKTKRWE
jgi:hypothetical protein